MVRGKVRGRHLDPVGAGDGLLDVVVDREAPQRARHLRLDVRVARVFRRGKNERVDAARRRNLLGDLIVDLVKLGVGSRLGLGWLRVGVRAAAAPVS